MKSLVVFLTFEFAI